MYKFLAVFLALFLGTGIFALPDFASAGEVVGGIGIRAAQLYNPDKDNPRGNLVVLEVFPGKPAAVHGVLPGDIITRIGDKDTSGTDINVLVADHLRGGEGTEVRLVIWRTSTSSKIEVNMTREMIAY